MNFKVPEVDLLSFVESAHEYYYKVLGKDDSRKKMPFSVTGIVKKVFPFEASNKAEEIATKYLTDGTPPYDLDVRALFFAAKFPPTATIDDKLEILKKLVIDHWAKSSSFGTSAHAILEECIASDMKQQPPTEMDDKTKTSVDAGLAFLAEEKKLGFEPLPIHELKICMPYARTLFHKDPHIDDKPLCDQTCCGISGSIDLILYNKETKKCKICDWKTEKKKTGDLLKTALEKWRLQLGLYHLMLGYALKPGSYDPVSMVIFQIHPDHVEKHVFGVAECEITVNKCLEDNVFWVNGWSDVSKATNKFTREHKACVPSEEPSEEAAVKTDATVDTK